MSRESRKRTAKVIEYREQVVLAVDALGHIESELVGELCAVQVARAGQRSRQVHVDHWHVRLFSKSGV
jgi:hypothetical protein